MAFESKQFSFGKDAMTVLDSATKEKCTVKYESLDLFKNRKRYLTFQAAIEALEAKMRIFLRQSFTEIDEEELERLTKTVVNLLSARLT